MQPVVEKFLRYVALDTQSDEFSESCPSTQKQLKLAKILFHELKEMGLKNVNLDENGYVMATLPANTAKSGPAIGFIAHMDTSPDMTAENVHPKIIENYDGGDILLHSKKKIVLSPSNFPELKDYKQETLITTDGTTLLGADDKAGVAEIMTAMEYLVQHPEIQHGNVRVGFTPDEEIGRGANRFDVKKFGADFAYTIDGGGLGELEYENFNAALAIVKITGRSVHPGYAKNKMINSMHIAKELDALLPSQQRPEHTQDYEGFFHLIDFNGTVEQTQFRYIIRDHDRDKFEKMKKYIESCVTLLNQKYGSNLIHIKLNDQYFNMKEKILPVFHVVETAIQAMKNSGVEPLVIPIRGGTDGARLSYMGLPTPNIFTGGHNFHGRFEYIPVNSMEKAVQVILNIIELGGRREA